MHIGGTSVDLFWQHKGPFCGAWKKEGKFHGRKGVLRKCKSKKPRLLPSLPVEIWETVLLHLDNMADLARFSLVSKFWYELIHSVSFWKRRPPSSILCSVQPDMTLLFCNTPGNLPPSKAVWQKFGELKRKSLGNLDVRGIASSHGILCTCTCLRNKRGYKVCVFDPFKFPASLKVLPPVSEGIIGSTEKVQGTYFKLNKSSSSYVIVLLLSNSLKRDIVVAVYHSTSGTWKRSKPVNYCIGGNAPFIGDSIYFTYVWPTKDQARIFRYDIASDSWSIKTYPATRREQEKAQEGTLSKHKKKLLLVETQRGATRVWLAEEEKETYKLTLLSFLQSPRLFIELPIEVIHGCDFLFLHLLSRHGQLRSKICAYHQPTGTWQCWIYPASDARISYSTKHKRLFVSALSELSSSLSTS